MKRAYYNALDALLMSRYHGMKFNEIMSGHIAGDENPNAWFGMIDKGERQLKYQLFHNFATRAYPDSAGLALLVPRAGDIAISKGGVLGRIEGFMHNAGALARICYIKDIKFYNNEGNFPNGELRFNLAGKGERVAFECYTYDHIESVKERDGKPFIVPQWEGADERENT